jgi:hypothetical protein
MDVGRPDRVGLPDLGCGSCRKNGTILVQNTLGCIATAAAFYDVLCESEVPVNHANAPVDRIKIGLRITLLAAAVGFLGNMDQSYANPVGVPEPNILVPVPSIRVGVVPVIPMPAPIVPVPWPDVYLFGGGYDRGRDVHDYRRRGAESRGAAHRDHGDQGRRR